MYLLLLHWKYNIKSKLQLSSAEVEDVLMSHSAVLEAAVVGKPHPSDIQHMTGYIVKKPGHEVSEKELQSLVDGG